MSREFVRGGDPRDKLSAERVANEILWGVGGGGRRPYPQ